MKFGVEMTGLETTLWESIYSGAILGGPTPHGSSKYDDFMRCPYRYYLAHKRRLTRDGIDQALEVGGAFHEAIAQAYEADYKASCQGHTEEQCAEAFTQALYDFVNAISGATCAPEVRRLADAWLVHFGPGRPYDWRARTLAIERYSGVEKPFPYTTRIDQVLGDDEDDKKYWIVDHKTMGRRYSDTEKGYMFNSQFIGQQYCMRQDKEAKKRFGKLRGTIASVIVKTQPVQLFQVKIVYDNSLVNRWARNMRQIWRQLDMCEAYGFWPQLYSNCYRYKKHCRFFEYCRTGGKSLTGLRKKTKKEF